MHFELCGFFTVCLDLYSEVLYQFFLDTFVSCEGLKLQLVLLEFLMCVMIDCGYLSLIFAALVASTNVISSQFVEVSVGRIDLTSLVLIASIPGIEARFYLRFQKLLVLSLLLFSLTENGLFFVFVTF